MSDTAPTRVAVVSDIHVSAHNAVAHDDPYGWVARFVDGVVRQRPDVVLIAGDVFDRHDPSARALGCVQEMLDVLSDDGRVVAIIGGNHDAEVGLTGSLRLTPRVHWFDADEPSTLVLHQYGLALHGQSVASARDVRNVQPGYPQPVSGLINIAMLHTSITGIKSKRVCHPTTLDALQHDTRYDAWVLGHVHERLLLHASPLIVFSGGPHPRHADKLLGDAGNEFGSDPGFIMLEVGASRATGFTQTAEGEPWRLQISRTR